jgi:hemoglobin
MAESMFDRIGGYSTINRVATAFYEKVKNSIQLAPYFEDSDIQTLVRHQTEFLGSIMGGPAKYSNKDLEQVHRFLDITDSAFDEMVSLMIAAFYDLHFEQADVDFIEEELLRRRRFICGRKPMGLA